jgi:vacuolar-type H+-ATPase subunit F/Vma7
MPEAMVLHKPLAIIGEEDNISGFKALGFLTYSVKEPQDSKSALEAVVKQECAVCLIEERFFRTLEEELNNYRNQPLPVFIPFTKSGTTVLFEDIIKGIRLRATGTF